MNSNSKSYRSYRVVFIIAVVWIIAIVVFHEQLRTVFNPKSGAIYWVAGGILASLVSLIWSAKVKPESLYGRVTCLFELVLFNVTFCFVLLELSLRFYSLVTNDPLTLPANFKDVTLVNERRTEKMQQLRFGFPFNSDGFFDTEFIRPKPDDVFRVLVLGDSFGVGTVPHTHHYLTLLEQQLEGLEPGMQIEVCNLGMSRTAPQHYLSLLNQIGDSLEPDLVMVGFFLGNDFQIDAVEDSFSSPWDSLMAYRVPVRFYRMAQANAEFVSWVPKDENPKPFVPKHINDWRLEKPTMPRNMFLKVQANRARVFDNKRPDKFYEYACKYVRQIAQVARKSTGKPLVVFIIPDLNQVDPEFRVEVDSFIKKNKRYKDWSANRWELEKPIRYLVRELNSDDIVVMDLLAAMQQAQVELESTYHLNNTHWNANGNRAAAAEIGRLLRAQWEQIVK